MTGEEIVFNEGYFGREAKFWYGVHNRMMGFRGGFNTAEDLPELSRGLSPEISQLIPALNQAKADMSHNMLEGANAVKEIGNGLIEVGKSYGMTEDEAKEIAGRLN